MTQQSHFWAYTPRLSLFLATFHFQKQRLWVVVVIVEGLWTLHHITLYHSDTLLLCLPNVEGKCGSKCGSLNVRIPVFILRLPVWLSGKEPSCQAEDTGDTRSGRSPGEGNGSLLQYSCLGNPMNRGKWLTTVHGVTKSQTRFSN